MSTFNYNEKNNRIKFPSIKIFFINFYNTLFFTIELKFQTFKIYFNFFLKKILKFYSF